MWKRILEIIKKEFSQLFRDPGMRVILFMPPIIETIIFGYAINMDVRNVKIAWMDRDNTPASRELFAEFESSPYFRVIKVLGREKEVKDVLDKGTVKAVVRVLPGFARDLLRGKTAGVQVLIDGTDSNTASIISSYATQIIARYASRIAVEQQIFSAANTA